MHDIIIVLHRCSLPLIRAVLNPLDIAVELIKPPVARIFKGLCPVKQSFQIGKPCHTARHGSQIKLVTGFCHQTVDQCRN